MKKTSPLFILSNGRVAAINKKDGSIIWEIKLSEYVGSGMAHGIGEINLENNQLFIGVSGNLLCLNPKDGSLSWKNDLKGWGYQFVSMANVNNEAASAAASSAATTAVVAGGA